MKSCDSLHFDLCHQYDLQSRSLLRKSQSHPRVNFRLVEKITVIFSSLRMHGPSLCMKDWQLRQSTKSSFHSLLVVFQSSFSDLPKRCLISDSKTSASFVKVVGITRAALSHSSFPQHSSMAVPAIAIPSKSQLPLQSASHCAAALIEQNEHVVSKRQHSNCQQFGPAPAH